LARFNSLRNGMLKNCVFGTDRASEVDWIKAEDNYIRIHAQGSSYLDRETLSHRSAAAWIPSDSFACPALR
jgi:hypothetical protein